MVESQTENWSYSLKKTKDALTCIKTQKLLPFVPKYMFPWKFKHKITFKILAMWSAPCHVRLHPVKFTVLRVIEFFIPWQITKRKKKKKNHTHNKMKSLYTHQFWLICFSWVNWRFKATFFFFLFWPPRGIWSSGPGTRSEQQLRPKLQLWQRQILNPLCRAGDQTYVPALPRRHWSCWTRAGSPIATFLKSSTIYPKSRWIGAF